VDAFVSVVHVENALGLVRFFFKLEETYVPYVIVKILKCRCFVEGSSVIFYQCCTSLSSSIGNFWCFGLCTF
jgi:hypothetical protein